MDMSWAWIIFYLTMGIIWSWYGELEYITHHKLPKTNFCNLISVAINSLLFPIFIWFGAFAHIAYQDTESEDGIMRGHSFFFDYLNKVKKVGLPEEK